MKGCRRSPASPPRSSWSAWPRRTAAGVRWGQLSPPYADPSVVAATTALRSRDHCGETGSAVSTGSSNTAGDREVTVPVLIVEGDHDAYFPPPAATEQRSLFTGSADVTAITLVSTGHALTLGRSAPQFATTIADWLAKRFPPTSPATVPGSHASKTHHKRTHRRHHHVRQHRHPAIARHPHFTG